MSQEHFCSRRRVPRHPRSRSPRRPAPQQTTARVRATEQRAQRATEQRSERCWDSLKALIDDLIDELETLSDNPWSLEDWCAAVQRADTRGLRYGATRSISTMARTATYFVRSRASQESDFMEGAANILKYAQHVARHCAPGATEHGLNRRVLKMLYDFLNTRLECAAILLLIDRDLGLDGGSNSDDLSQVERTLRVHILEEAQQRGTTRGSQIKVALGLSPTL